MLRVQITLWLVGSTLNLLLECERDDALHALLIRPIPLGELLAHELFLVAQLDPKAGGRDPDGDKSAQVPEGNGGRERPVTAAAVTTFCAEG